MKIRLPALCFLLTACGASPRMLHQSSVYYEQCRAEELNPARSVDQRRECWAAWLLHYAEGQPIERVGYAQERRIALAYGEELAPLPDRLDPSWEVSSEPEPSEPAPPLPATTQAIEQGPSQAEPVENAPADRHTEHPEQEFRQDSGAPPGRHFAVRSVPPPQDAPPPRPPSGGGIGACSRVCDPAWNRCVARCTHQGVSCVRACEGRFARCQAACH